MDATKVAQRAGENADLIEIKTSQATRRYCGAVKVQYAVGRVDADNQVGFETIYLLMQKLTLRL